MELQPGVYDIFVSSPGFDPACRKLDVASGKTATYNVQLAVSRTGNEE